MTKYKGKAIYQPSGKAEEYAKWACNFYVGCSNGCEYCYCKKGILAGVMGQDKPQLKKCFKDENHALEVFEKELRGNLSELRKHGLFFSFTTDPMLPETLGLTMKAHTTCKFNKVPVAILTKSTDWIDKFKMPENKDFINKNIAFGFTLTGHDELEPGASTNAERIAAMKRLHDAGFKTFASIEPIIDFNDSYRMMEQTKGFCDHYKIGLMSGKKYDEYDLVNFGYHVMAHFTNIYFKDSFLKILGLDRDCLPDICVTRNFNIFQP